MMLVPIALHRRLFGDHVKDRLVRTAHRLVIVVLFAIGLLISGIVLLIFDVVVGRGVGIAVGVIALLIVVGLLAVLPAVIEHEALDG